MNLLGKIPKWLGPALNLQEATIPNQLDTSAILPVIDVGQGGWANAVFRVGQSTQGSSAIAASFSIRDAETGLGRERGALLLYLAIGHFGGAAAGVVEIRLKDPVRSINIPLKSFSIPAGGSWMYSSDFMPVGNRLFIPANHSLTAEIPATGAGESYTINYTISAIEGGYKPV